MKKVSTAIRHKKNPVDQDEVFPLYLRVIHERITYWFSLGIKVSPNDLNKISRARRLGVDLQQVREKIKKELDRADEIIAIIDPFCIRIFRERFNGKKSNANQVKEKSIHQSPDVKTTNICRADFELIPEIPDPAGFTLLPCVRRLKSRKYPRIKSNFNFKALGPLAVCFGDYIRELEKDGRVGTAECYFTTLMSLLSFRGDLSLHDINKEFLVEYTAWMKSNKKTVTTIAIYLRSLRAIINVAIDEKKFNREDYPFGRGRSKFQIRRGRKNKRALSQDTIKLLYDYNCEGADRNVRLGRDMWFWLLFGNGENPTDATNLKFKDINGRYVYFTREKTKNATEDEPPKITVYLNDDMLQIMDRWANKDQEPENYVFPILKNGLSVHRRKAIVKAFTMLINKAMKFICDELGIEEKVTCMTARHSYSTTLKRKGVSTEFIREGLGHTTLTTTQNYLDSFEDETIMEVSAKLLEFKKLPTVSQVSEAKAI